MGVTAKHGGDFYENSVHCCNCSFLFGLLYSASVQLKNYIITAADPRYEAADGTIATFRGFLRCLLDAEEMSILYKTGTWDREDVYKHPAFEQAYQMGKEV